MSGHPKGTQGGPNEHPRGPKGDPRGSKGDPRGQDVIMVQNMRFLSVEVVRGTVAPRRCGLGLANVAAEGRPF